MKGKKKYLLIFLLILLLSIAYNWSLISYGLMQGRGQYKVLKDAKAVSYYFDAPTFPDSLKIKLKVLDRIKSFAVDEWELPALDQYNTMYDQGGKDVLWVVTAAYPYEMRNYSWEFPFLGEVTYKGFFDYNKALIEAEVLKKNGYDTRIRPVGAWSTLGWFQDPLLSNMLFKSEGKLAEVIFHELIHDEVYIKDSTDFNENLANFFGKQMAQHYLAEQAHPIFLNLYLARIEDEAHLNNFMNGQLSKLDSLFSINQHLTDQSKDKLKYEFYRSLRKQLKEEHFNQVGFAENISRNDSLNNAHLLAYNRYGGYQSQLEQQLVNDFDGNLLQMLAYYKVKYGKN